ncbi:MAG TPA: hypothetical protein VGQ33_20255, partial [Vicinamibacteria bacterium]|nr:hypothetical protein [Vicinamibacteria bacterium]
MSVRRGLVWPAIASALVGCRAQPAPSVIRLADIYRPEAIVGRVPEAPPRPRTEWRFDAPAPAWDAPAGVAGLAIREGHLTGRTTSDFPILHVERSDIANDRDLLHEVQVRARVSKGGTL